MRDLFCVLARSLNRENAFVKFVKFLRWRWDLKSTSADFYLREGAHSKCVYVWSRLWHNIINYSIPNILESERGHGFVIMCHTTSTFLLDLRAEGECTVEQKV